MNSLFAAVKQGSEELQLSPRTVFDEDENDREDFAGFPSTDEKVIISKPSFICQKCTRQQSVIKYCNDTPVVHSFSDTEISGTVLNADNAECSDDDKEEKISIYDIVALCDKLITGLEQRTFISEQERLLRQKPLSLKPTILNMDGSLCCVLGESCCGGQASWKQC
ncbi:hypothetical protein PR048_013977 [Dryococelus australis]|uniref:Uncharacterized protein n=1 Tax=Dryococelus australis TaxID=614101 RepID=A0ABQ9HTQ0_9NEOP|nr:hypothetical protein PR048_013977 [Dryococelus australis]